MSPGCGQIDWQQRKALQNRFHKGGALGPDRQLHGTMHPVEEFARGDN
jgi:hypothetical protein